MDGIPAIPHQRNHPEAARRHSAAAPDATAGIRPGSPADAPDTAGGAPAGTAPAASARTPGAASPADPDVTGADDAHPAPAPTATRFAVLGPIRAWRGSEVLPSGTPSSAPCSPRSCCAAAVPPPRPS